MVATSGRFLTPYWSGAGRGGWSVGAAGFFSRETTDRKKRRAPINFRLAYGGHSQFWKSKFHCSLRKGSACILGVCGGKDFFFQFLFVPNRFPSGSQYVPNVPPCSSQAFPIAPHFKSHMFCPTSSPSHLYSWAKGKGH